MGPNLKSDRQNRTLHSDCKGDRYDLIFMSTADNATLDDVYMAIDVNNSISSFLYVRADFNRAFLIAAAANESSSVKSGHVWIEMERVDEGDDEVLWGLP